MPVVGAVLGGLAGFYVGCKGALDTDSPALILGAVIGGALLGYRLGLGA